MESPGEYLKREREQRGVTLESVFEATRVPLNLLEAIESDDFDAQHPTFIKGFIRSYCKHLGLDENDALLRYEIFIKEQSGKEDKKPEVTDGAGRGETSAATVRPENSSRRNIAVLAVVGVVAILLFYVLSPMLSERKTGSITAPVATPDVPDKVISERAPKAVTQAPVPASGALVEKESTGRQDKGATETDARPTAQKSPAIESPPRELREHILTVKAVEEVWIETWVDGAKPVDVILKPGETLKRSAENGIYIVIGNAGGVEINFDGELIELFGHSGKVVRLKLPSGYDFKVPPRVLKPAKAKQVPSSALPVKEEKREAQERGPVASPVE